MTIKELETRTGISRANIRYYEREGLLSPRRLDNGYRDYTEEDVRTLEKIKLLRGLRLDLDTIRLVQQGELPLDRALFPLLTKLEGDRAGLERAAEVCRKIQASGVEYAALDPEPFLRELAFPRRPFPGLASGENAARTMHVPVPEEGTAWARLHPFRRFFARLTDLTLYGVAVQGVLLLGLGWNWQRAGNGLTGLDHFYAWCAIVLLPLLLMFLCEPFLLHFWGWTPGKRLFGLKLLWSEKGGRLSLGEGFARTAWVVVSGCGLGIPLVSLWRLIRCWYWCQDGKDCPWDEQRQYCYLCREREWSGLWFILIQGAALTAGALIFLQAWLPPNRGGLSVAEFAENYNFYRRFAGYTMGTVPMDERGQWAYSLDWSGTTARCVRSVTYHTGADGTVTGVTFTETSLNQGELMDATSTEFYLAALALAGSRHETDLFSFQRERSLLMGPTQRGLQEQEGTWEYAGLRGEWIVSYTGYREEYGVLEPAAGEEQAFSRRVTLSLQKN